MRFKTNIPIVSASILKKLKTVTDREYLLRPVAFDIISLMTDRIHQDGKASDGSQIGTYSTGYMVLRTGKYKNATKKTSGVFTKKLTTAFTQEDDDTVSSKKKFVKTEFLKKERPKYNRSDDTKVVVSLTRQLENDWSVIATDKGYGIGFLNPFNFQKATWVEKTYNKKIFSLSKEEKQHAETRLQQLLTDALNS